MQKKMIALAIAAAFAAPVAMADVTVYGSMDGGLRHQTNDTIAAGGTTDSMQMGQYNTARLGFKSVEDMGDGLKTNVVLESSLFPASVGNPGASASNPFGLLFDRQATLGVSGGWGSFDMGWNYTASFKVIKTYDPFDYKYLGIAQAKTSNYQDRAGSLAYTGKFGDVGVIAEYYVNNASKTTQPTNGAGRALGVTYASGAINAGFAYTAVEAGTTTDDALTNMTAGAGFKYSDDGKVSIGYAKETQKNGTASDKEETNMWLGVAHKMTDKVGVTAAYYSRAQNPALGGGAGDKTSKVMMVGATYGLSKKTEVYLGVDRTTANSGATGASDTVTSGVSAGLSTVF